MAEKPTNPAPIGEIEHGPSKFEQFLDRNQKKLIIGILVLIAGVSAMIVMRGLREEEDNSAGEALTAAGDSSSTYELAALRDVIDNFKESPASGSAAVLLAEEQWKDNRRDDAIETLRGFVAENPEHAARPTALMALGLHLLEQDKTEEASSTLQQVVDSPNGRHLAPFALLTLGDLRKRAGDNDAAKALYEQANQNYPENNPSMMQFINQRIALLGVEPPTKIAPPPVPEPPTNPTNPTPLTPTPGGGLFPELETPTPAIPGIPAGGIPGVPTPPTNPAPPAPTPPDQPETPASGNPESSGTPAPVSPADPEEDPPTDAANPAATDSNQPPKPGTPADPTPPVDTGASEAATEGASPPGEAIPPAGPGTPPAEENETP
jgi:predicted negative regulator of RcsB-dependent stress response